VDEERRAISRSGQCNTSHTKFPGNEWQTYGVLAQKKKGKTREGQWLETLKRKRGTGSKALWDQKAKSAKEERGNEKGAVSLYRRTFGKLELHCNVKKTESCN